MKKLKFPDGFTLIGTSNDGYRHRYSVNKNEKFKGIFIKFMGELGFDKKKVQCYFIGQEEDGDSFPLKIAEFNDCCLYWKNKEYEVDVFFGNRKIILVIRILKEEQKSRRKMLNDLESKSNWIKPVKITPIKAASKNKNHKLNSPIVTRRIKK